MSFSKRARRPAGTLVLMCALAGLAACTAGPLYGTTGSDALGQPTSILTELRGRIRVASIDTRTEQIVRNELDFRLNGAERVSDPLYELRLSASAADQTVSIQAGTGVPTAGLFRLEARYELVRLSDGQSIASGTRFATAPYDRSDQIFASQRAVLDARETSGRDLANRILLAVTPVLQRDYFAPATTAVPKG